MAKIKTKIGPIETKCEEVRSGVWQFDTGYYVWQFSNFGRFNLAVINKDDIAKEGKWHPMLFAKNLDHAVMFAQGYEAGASKHRHPACRNSELERSH